ncbi:MAG: hypothetical protein WKF75_01050 [Singulisphaera sp.]
MSKVGPAQGEDATYEELARQYEQFQPINRTFELVAKAVKPAVVHIVAARPSAAMIAWCSTTRRPARGSSSADGVGGSTS